MITSLPAVPAIVGVAQLGLALFLPFLGFGGVLPPFHRRGRGRRVVGQDGVLGLVTLAVLVSVPSFFVLTTIVTVAVVAAFTWPRSQVTVPPLC